jgi:signal transduction histidine kinase
VLVIPGLMLVLTWLPLVFPTGRLLAPRWRWMWWGTGAIALLNMCYWAIRPGDIERFPGVPNAIRWIALQPLVDLLDTAVMWGIIGTIFVSGVSVWMRFRRSAGEERQQIKWLVCAVGAWSGTALFSLFVAWFYPDEIWQIELALALLFAAIPITVGNAVLRYRLYDIDLLINRTLVYGALTATIVAIYVLVVGYLGALFNARGNVSISLIATGLVAVLFAPLRDRLQRGVNRLLYGERDEPYTALTRLGQRLEATLAPDAVLPTIGRTVAEALKLPYVAITLHTPDRPFAAQRVIVAEHGQAPQYPSSLRMLPLFYGGETVGELQLAPRRPNEPLSGADDRLLADLARQAGAAVQAVQLTAALQAGLDDVRRSRERLVTAQEEERRRIQRDLHDGLGPVLASMRLRLEACLDRAHDEAPDLAHDLERLHALVGQATTDIRRLVYNLRPPALDQLGLPALRQHVHRWERETGVAVQLDAALNAPLPAAVDVTLFRIVHKALVNVHKHARATEVKLDLAQHNAGVTLLVQDNGVGGAATNAGTGLESMRERAELVGGTLAMESASGAGTKLAVQLPLRGEHHD